MPYRLIKWWLPLHSTHIQTHERSVYKERRGKNIQKEHIQNAKENKCRNDTLTVQKWDENASQNAKNFVQNVSRLNSLYVICISIRIRFKARRINSEMQSSTSSHFKRFNSNLDTISCFLFFSLALLKYYFCFVKSSFAKQQPCIGNISSRASTLSSKTEIALMAKSQNGALLLLQTHTHNTHTRFAHKFSFKCFQNGKMSCTLENIYKFCSKTPNEFRQIAVNFNTKSGR